MPGVISSWRSWRTNISIISLWDCNEYISMRRGHRVFQGSVLIPHHFLSHIHHESLFRHCSSIFIDGAEKHSVPESTWLVASTADLTQVLHHSAAGKDTCPLDLAAPLEVGVRKWTPTETGLPPWTAIHYLSLVLCEGGYMWDTCTFPVELDSPQS